MRTGASLQHEIPELVLQVATCFGLGVDHPYVSEEVSKPASAQLLLDVLPLLAVLPLVRLVNVPTISAFRMSGGVRSSPRSFMTEKIRYAELVSLVETMTR